jgi:HlyD family secretion protein
MKKKILIIIGAIPLALIAILVFKPFSKKKAEYTFDTVKVEKGSITNTVTATGTIEAIQTISVGTQVSGLIDKIYVDFNDNVKKGQILAKLDETALKAQVDQSQSQVNQAQAQLDYEGATYNRLKALFDKNLIAQADFDQAVYNYENAKAALSNAKSALDRAKVQLAYATIYSPIDGVVLNRAIELGQTVAASFSTPELFTIANDLTQMKVETSVDEADIGKVNNGQRVEFTVDAYPDLKFEGTVSQVRLQPVTTNNVVTYTVILSAPNPDKKLMPGMTASATIYVEEKQNTLIVSGKAIRFTPKADYLKTMMSKVKMPAGGPNTAQSGMSSMPFTGQGMPTGTPPAGIAFPTAAAGSDVVIKNIWVKAPKDGISPVPITIGIDNGSSVEVLSGLKEGDEVVISMSNTGTAAATRQNGGPGGPFPF